jgi:hypothetical protein
MITYYNYAIASCSQLVLVLKEQTDLRINDTKNKF